MLELLFATKNNNARLSNLVGYESDILLFQRGWDMYVHRAGPCGLETGQCEDITEERQKGVEIFSLRPERRGLRPVRPVQQPLRNFKYLTIDL